MWVCVCEFVRLLCESHPISQATPAVSTAQGGVKIAKNGNDMENQIIVEVLIKSMSHPYYHVWNKNIDSNKR